MNISNCPSLKYFKNAYAENIDTSHNPLLKELHCEYGTFDALDLSNNPMLEKLTCYSCKNLNELNLSRNLALRELENGSVFVQFHPAAGGHKARSA